MNTRARMSIFEKIEADVERFIEERYPADTFLTIDGMAELLEEAKEAIADRNIEHDLSTVDLIIIFKALADEGSAALGAVHDAMTFNTNYEVGEELIKAMKEHFIHKQVSFKFTNKVLKLTREKGYE